MGLGDGGVPELSRAGRVFGNATEYVPSLLIALVLLALVGAPALLVHGIGGAFFLGRVAHAFGLSRSAGISAGRALGVLLTWGGYLAAAGALLFYAF